MRIYALALVLLAALAGPATPAAKPSSTPAAKQHASAPALSDAELEKLIRAKFAKSKISTNNFQVRVSGGTATLTGRTNVVQHKGTATRLAKNAGALRVDNRIEVSEDARRTAATSLSRSRTPAKVQRSEVPERQ